MSDQPPSPPRSLVPLSPSLSLYFSLSVSLFSLSVSTHSRLARIITTIALMRSLHSLLCGVVALPCDASAAHPGQPQCGREPRCQQSTRRIFSAQPQEFIPLQSSAVGSCSFSVGCDLHRQLQLKSQHLPHVTSQLVAYHASLNGCLVQLHSP